MWGRLVACLGLGRLSTCPTSSQNLFRSGLGAAVLVFAPRRPSPLSRRLGQPGWRPPPPASPSSRQPLQADNGFFDLNSFLAQFRQDLGYIHSGSPICWPPCSENGTDYSVHGPL